MRRVCIQSLCDEANRREKEIFVHTSQSDSSHQCNDAARVKAQLHSHKQTNELFEPCCCYKGSIVSDMTDASVSVTDDDEVQSCMFMNFLPSAVSCWIKSSRFHCFYHFSSSWKILIVKQPFLLTLTVNKQRHHMFH